jgi:hypothetical protein
MKISLPDGWHEVTVGQFQEINQTDKAHEVFSILADEDPEIIRKADPQSAARIADQLSFIKSLPNEDHYKRFIEIGGAEYYLIENLNSFCNGEWVDMEEYLKDFYQNLHLILAMLYRPVGEYKAEDVGKRAELFKEKMMIGDVYGSFVFFSHVGTKSINSIQRYLILQTLMKMRQSRKKESVLQKKERQRNGAGIRSSTPSLRVI